MIPEEMHQLPDEKELLSRLAAGDEPAFTSIYLFYQPRLFRYVFPFSLSRPFAEEIVQDVLFKLWSSRETLTGILHLENYLRRMAKNKLLDNLKKLATEEKYRNRMAIAEAVPAHSEDDLVFKEYHQIAWNAIEKLPPKQKQVFLLRHRGDLSLDEIAAATGSTRFAVQKNLTRAAGFIKEQLREYGALSLPVVYLLARSGG